MRNLSDTLAFIDLLFNLLIGITTMFIISYMLINPPEDSGEVTPPVIMMITMEWDPESAVDMDLWVRSAAGSWIGFNNRDNGYMSLERDDMGSITDTYTVNGEEVIVKRNYEVINITALPQGEYFVNSHYWSTAKIEPVDVTIEVQRLNPYDHVFEGTHTLTTDQEHTFLSFIVDAEGRVTDIRTDIQLHWISTQSRGDGGDW